MQKLMRMTAISSLVFGAFTVNEARAAAAGTIFFDRHDLKQNVTISGPGLPEGGVKNAAWVVRTYETLKDAIQDVYFKAGHGSITREAIGSIKQAATTLITAETDFAALTDSARMSDVSLEVTIAPMAFIDIHPAVSGLPIFFDKKDFANTVTISGPGLPDSGATAPAWVVRNRDALNEAIIKAYQKASYSGIVSADIGPIKKTGITPVTTEADFEALTESARTGGGVSLEVAIASHVLGAYIH